MTALLSEKSLPGVDRDGTVHVCAWCWPGTELVRAFPHLAGEKITHGVCARHQAEMLASIRNLKFQTAHQLN